uniref:NADH-quinone oxidoreductase subunit E n=1 Tax=Candidatus Aschnera chinzeii TaxID=1485666 RepID=A0AAT9G4C8_9ENTR|nr:MAG: NADH-quinone oxidoreductase subunit NuoE [Candidatus Aschnera chinzeii]
MNNNKSKFILSKIEEKEINTEKTHYLNSKAASIEALKIIQKHRGWIEDDAIYAIANLLNVTPNEIESIATFYSQIYRKPVGLNIIKYCDSMVCYINGYKSVELEIKNLLKITTGETTKDNKFTLLNTCCLGNCDKAPTIMINDDTYHHITPINIKNILEKY